MGRQAFEEAASVRSDLPHEDYVTRGDSDHLLGCSLDREGRVVTARGAWEPMLGWRPEQLAGVAFTALIDPEDRGRVHGALVGVAERRSARGSMAAPLRTSSGG